MATSPAATVNGGARRTRQRRHHDPRGHWILVALLSGALGICLMLNGYAHGTVSPHGMVSAASGPDRSVPANIKHGGPVVAAGTSHAAAMQMPAKTIALTFDGGPDRRWTPRILALLRRYGAHATFFEAGARAVGDPAVVREALQDGDAVGTEGYSPGGLSAVSWLGDLDLTLAQNALAGSAGIHTRLLRLPEVASQRSLTKTEWQTVQTVRNNGYLVVFPGKDTRDWALPGVNTIVRRAMPDGKRGEVVTMQDGGASGPQTLAALRVLLPRLHHRGYQFTTVTKGLGFPSADPAVRGNERTSGDALVLAQHVAVGVVTVLTVLLLVTVVLNLLRLLVLLGGARTHRRRMRRLRSLRDATSLPFSGPISVIVPAFNEAAGVAATLLSLCEARYLSEVEILVIDDGSTDRTAEISFNLRIPGIRVISQPNSGKSAALNTGIALASHDIVVLLDGDTVFERTALERLVAPFSDPEVAAVSGNTKVGNRRGLLGRWQHIEYVMGFNLERRLYDLFGAMPTIPGAIGAFRRDVLLRLGGLSADTLAEDTDLTMTICRAGYRVAYVEDARAWTEVPTSLRQLWRQRYRWSYGTMQAMWKHREAIGERKGRLGWCLIYMVAFHVVMPLFAPLIDVFAAYGIFAFNPGETLVTWLAFTGIQFATALYAFRLDRESVGSLWALPLQQIVFRQLLYLVGIQSVVTALLGGRLGWQPTQRTGAFSASTPGGRLPRRALPAASPARSFSQ
ncbi:MAG: glycosyltransferase [Nocardiopsaceae bacterium]|nr:glycosyltransferase [Nocardiopsaceae bacterium]